MPIRVYRSGDLAKDMAAVVARAKWLRPAMQRVGEFVAREARRRAPVGAYKGGTLKRSLHHVEPEHNVTALASDVAHALPQQYGARIGAPAKAGGVSPPPKMLAIPLTYAARALLDSLGARRSLRTVEGLRMIVAKSGTAFLVRDLDKKEAAKAARAGLDRHGKIKRDVRGTRVEFLFVLRPATRLQPNPPPKGYAPAMDEPALRDFVNRTIRRYLTSRRDGT